MTKKKKTPVEVKTFTVKKCPYCYNHLAVNAQRCDMCGKRVGPVESTGWARKTVEVKAYLKAIVAVGAFLAFFWWAFMR